MTDAPGPDPAAPTALTIEPVVSWPHEVRAGGLYQLTVDVRPAADAGAWPFPREEVTVHLQLFCPPGIVPTLMTEPAVVLHRFGGTYGPARYVLAVDDAVRSGSLQLVLSNRAGVPFHVAGLAFRAVPQVRPEPEAPAPREPPVTTVHVTRTVAGDPGLPAAPAHGTDDLSGRQDISPHEDVHADDRPHLETLGFCRPDGSRVVWEVEMMPGPAVRTRNFRTRYGRYQNFPLAIRYAVGGESAEFALENAVGAGLRMLRFFDADRRWPWEGNPQRYPWELSRLVGYDVECDVPFAITVEFGMPLAGLRSSGTAGSLSSPDDLRAFTVGLARGLAVLDRLGVVHRQIRENTVHWDARSRVVQINRFEYARRAGEPRGRLARVGAPGERALRDWEAPEQITGGGLVDPRDDVFSAGCAILGVTARGLCIGPDGIPDASASGVPWLVHLLDGVFGPVATRPDAAELLRRLGHDDVLTDLPRPEHDGLAEGHAAYDHLMALKDPRRIPPARQVPSPTAPAPDTAP